MMRFVFEFRRLALALALFLTAASAAAHAQTQPAQQGYAPRVGQPGKDVVWVPTPDSLVDKMLDIAKVTPNDYLIDLGSGDGRTVITAAKRGTRAHGIEYNAEMVELSKRNAAGEGVGDRATFAKADLFESDLSQATVITMFLLPQINLKLRPKILDLKPGTRIVSNSFTMGEWEEDESASVGEDCSGWCTALLWIVPAKVEGNWKLADGELVLKQSFQKISGTIRIGNRTVPIAAGRLRGDEIYIRTNDNEYRGQVSGDTISGTSKSGAEWKATRAGR
ncbi:MAG: SAM-dependent methyltransferase [Candidatus Binatia bacterium]